ncbi:carbohydrate ABC transporter permease [Paenibacillus glucanolyticus]|uniref:carbohydrate ABC transporter permease n=1 Tax=Paenibacillus TaxID=44249 RepID=UPI0003E2821C|nr:MULTISPECIES: carbohydrate ABC transporter permease [Paenibacillus]ANA81113.1 sugar ABC transporter ATP-binding protein [Paenibacillus glucanolyticus]AVV54768.1 carbohydrate ABC transporter permease [Paenibacillus glucanolyticus]ETT33719.1 CUT1 family carbohydrate ABC transporter membrane protein 2 [Paenibacillus sp. FSL R5-808]
MVSIRTKFKGQSIETYVIYIILILAALAYIIPFLWLISGSLKSNTELFADPPVWIPSEPVWSNYVTAFQQFPFWLYFKNTLYICAMAILGGVLANTLVAYGFSRIEWKGRDALFIVVLMTMMLPFQVTMIPLFVLFQKFGWIGTFKPLVVPAFLGNAYFIFLLRQFFIGIPKELSQPAKVDGASEFRIYWQLTLPLSLPVIITVAIFAFTGAWGDFIGPLVFLSDNKLYTLSLGIQQIMSVNDPRWTLLMAVGVSMTLPVLVIFFLLQKYFIQGITFSGIKG